HCLSVDRHSRAHHVDHPWCAVGGSLERRGRNESALRSEFAQRGYRFPAAIGEACRSARFRPYAPNLRCIALLPRLRRQPAIESAQSDAVAGELLFHPRFLRIPRLATILLFDAPSGGSFIHFLAILACMLVPGGVRSFVESSL